MKHSIFIHNTPSYFSVIAATILIQTFLSCQLYSHETEQKQAFMIFQYGPTAVPDRIVLTWTGDPSTSQAVTWRTDPTVRNALAEITQAEDGPKFVDKAEQVAATSQELDAALGPALYHTANFTGLQPKTKYVYRVGDGTHWSEWSQFTTAADGPEPFTFVYFGDAQNNIKSMWSRVVREAYADAPRAAFLLHAGDLINNANRDAEWGEWFYATSHIHRTMACIATPGNHEYSDGALSKHWRPTFAFPENGPRGLEETVYYTDYQNVRIVSLNSMRQVEEQKSWLTDVLSDNKNRWTIITFHFPIYSAGADRDNPDLRNLWQPVFDRFRVDLVLQGHDHTYARSGLRTHENVPTGVTAQSPAGGTVYVVSVSGPKMYTLKPLPDMKRVAANTQLYQIITIDGNELHYQARTATGKPYDGFTLRKRKGHPNQLIEKIPSTPERRE
jgi:3',5'-cyclic AMP phosphodiesterase CpdA